MLYSHIVTDIKNINAKHKNNKVNTVSIEIHQKRNNYNKLIYIIHIFHYDYIHKYYDPIYKTKRLHNQKKICNVFE